MRRRHETVARQKVDALPPVVDVGDVPGKELVAEDAAIRSSENIHRLDREIVRHDGADFDVPDNRVTED